MGGFLEAEEESAAAGSSADGAAAAAVGLALDRAGRRRGKADSVADRFLARQEELVAKQLHHLDEQFRHLRLKSFSERLKVTLQLLTILVGVLALAGVGWMAWTASQDRGLVIDGFGAPADMAQQGANGAALAGEVQDALARLHDETVSNQQLAIVRERPASEVKVEIPETGVSITELNQALREWLGHETHVRGELTRVASGPDAGGLALSIRVDGAPGARLVRKDGDVEALVGQAAEFVYRTTEPYQYVLWLDEHGRTPDAIRFVQDRIERGSRAEKLYALGALNGLYDVAWPLQQSRDTAAYVVAQGQVDQLNNLAIQELNLGHWEQSAADLRAAARVKQGANVTSVGRKLRELNQAANLAGVTGDNRARLTQACFEYGVSPCTAKAAVDAAFVTRGGSGFDAGSAQIMALLAGALATLHETQLAERVLAIPHPPEGRSPAYYARVQSYWLRAVSRQAEVEEDWPRALAAADQWDALAAQWPGLRYWDRTVLTRALALAHTGRMAEAQRLIRATPGDCYPCLVLRGQIADLAGQRTEADRWFAEALRQGPSLPFAEGNWARALLARGDVAGALAKARASLKKNPNYVEAAMTLAEAKLARGDAAGAAAGLSELAKTSPGWGRLHLKWGEALARQGKGAEARAQFAAAARLGLTPSERAELAGRKA